MQYNDLNCPQFFVGEAMPTARAILKASQRLATELATTNSPCSNQEYLAYFSSAAVVLSTLTTHNLQMEDWNA